MLADAVAAALPGLRAEVESLMTSTCTVRAKGSGEPVTDPDTGIVTIPAGALVYSGPCRIKPGGTRSQATDAGGAEVFSFDFEVSLPFSATGVHEGMTLHVDSSPDPDAVGLDLEVQLVARGEHITARRLMCNEVA